MLDALFLFLDRRIAGTGDLKTEPERRLRLGRHPELQRLL